MPGRALSARCPSCRQHLTRDEHRIRATGRAKLVNLRDDAYVVSYEVVHDCGATSWSSHADARRERTPSTELQVFQQYGIGDPIYSTLMHIAADGVHWEFRAGCELGDRWMGDWRSTPSQAMADWSEHDDAKHVRYQ